MNHQGRQGGLVLLPPKLTELLSPVECRTCEEDEDPLDTYDIDGVTAAQLCWRVVCRNKNIGKHSGYLGPQGHLERCNVLTHLAAFFAFAAFVLMRIWLEGGQRDSVSSILAWFSYAAYSFTFLSSSIYHVASAHPFWSAYARQLDYFAIYVGLVVSHVTDLSIATLNLVGSGGSWRAWSDAPLAALVLFVFFLLRRLLLTPEETRKTYFAEKKSMGICRATHVDLEHSSLRAIGGTVLAYSWILTTPLAAKTLDSGLSHVFVASRVTATLLLCAGMLFDNAIAWPDRFFEKNNPPHCACYSRTGGFVLNSHAIWHLVAFASTLVTAAGTEYVVSSDAFA